MHRLEPYSKGSRHFLYEDPQLGPFNSMASALPASGPISAANTVIGSESTLLNDGQDRGHMPGGIVADLFDGQDFFGTDEYNNDSRMGLTGQYYGPPMSASSFDSVMSDSTFASGHTMDSSVEQGVDSVENLDKMFEDIDFIWSPELLLANKDPSSTNVVSRCPGHEWGCASMENDDSFHVEGSVANPGMDVLLPAVSRSARTWPCVVRLVCACHRFRSKIGMTLKGLSKKGVTGKRKRSAESNKHPCEIRISKKIPRDGRYLKEKAWLGTFATPAQMERALDVGKYFLCAKKNKTFSNPKSKAVLSPFEDHLQALPLTELVETVTKMAKHYGEKGSLPQNLNDL